MANSVDPDLTIPLGLDCLGRHICPNVLDKYGISVLPSAHFIYSHVLIKDFIILKHDHYWGYSASGQNKFCALIKPVLQIFR